MSVLRGPRGRYFATAALASLLVIGALSITSTGPPASAQAAPSAAGISWSPRGDRTDDQALIDEALQTWRASSTTAPPSGAHVLLAATDPVFGALVILQAVDNDGQQRVATLTGSRTAPSILILRDDHAARDLASQHAIAVLTSTPEDRVDDSRLAVILAAPDTEVAGVQSSAFDIYRQHEDPAPYLSSVVPAEATVTNTNVLLSNGTTVALARASTMGSPPTVGDAAIDYVPAGYYADRPDPASTTQTIRTLTSHRGTIAITEQRGVDLQAATLTATGGAQLAPANPHEDSPMYSVQMSAGYAFAWTNSGHTRGYTVTARGPDAQILAYHTAQAMHTP